LSSTITEVETIIRKICATPKDDGIVFDAESVEGARIKEDDEYDGARLKFQAELSGARIPMQVDIGFGDAVYPEPELASFPVLLAMEAPLIRAYPREATIAEKFHAMVALDIRNSRMKDFYDIWFMANTWEFEMESLRKAIEFSFGRRGTPLPEDTPFALTDSFLDDAQKENAVECIRQPPGCRRGKANSRRSRCRSSDLPFAMHFERIKTGITGAVESNASLALRRAGGLTCVVPGL
jgi:nucleotidyltransferase AbiEii toxin of type IV toxin-antitoxin system